MSTAKSSPTAAALVLGALLAACGTAAPYVSATADLSTIKSVAVLPFENVTTDKLGPERVQRIFMTELLALGLFDPAEPGQVTRALRLERIDPAGLTPEDVQKLGKALGVQAVFVGSLIEYDEARSGSVGAQVSLHLRLLDAVSGKTVWSSSRSASGTTVSGRIFGMGSRTATEVAQRLIREELEKLVR